VQKPFRYQSQGIPGKRSNYDFLTKGFYVEEANRQCDSTYDNTAGQILA